MKRLTPKFAMALLGATLCIAFFFVYAFLPLSAPSRPNSPDEMSNAFFAKQFAAGGRLWLFDQLNPVTGGVAHPRGTRVVDDMIVPIGFLGVPVFFGLIAKATGAWALPFLTPLLAILGVLAWTAIISRYFGRRVGIVSGILLLVHPAWWYWASRVFMPNVPFLALAMIGAYFMLVAPIAAAAQKKEYRGVGLLSRSDGAIAGVCFGLALAMRTSEIYWMAFAALAIIAMYRREVSWARMCIAVFFTAAVFVPFLFLNQSLYGNAFMTGYGQLGDTALPQTGGRAAALLGPLRPLLFPLGFAPRTAVAHAWTYGVVFFWWWSVLLGIAGIFAMYRRERWSREAKTYGMTASVVAIWLILFYGSWTFQDNPDPSAITIGASYLRYWLPIFVMSTVPAAWFFNRMTYRMSVRRGVVSLGIACLIVTGISAFAVFGAKQEGLLALRQTLFEYDAAAKLIIERTEPTSIIIVDRADKFLFPERSVVYPLRDERTYTAIPILKRHGSLYYFGITLPDKDVQYLNDEKLKSSDLVVETVTSIGEETLYAFRSIKK